VARFRADFAETVPFYRMPLTSSENACFAMHVRYPIHCGPTGIRAPETCNPESKSTAVKRRTPSATACLLVLRERQNLMPSEMHAMNISAKKIRRQRGADEWHSEGEFPRRQDERYLDVATACKAEFFRPSPRTATAWARSFPSCRASLARVGAR